MKTKINEEVYHKTSKLREIYFNIKKYWQGLKPNELKQIVEEGLEAECEDSYVSLFALKYIEDVNWELMHLMINGTVEELDEVVLNMEKNNN